MNDMNSERIRLRILVPLALAMVALIGATVWGIYWLQRRHINEEVRSRVKGVEQLLQHELEEQAELLNRLIDFIKRDKNLQSTWLAKDRDALLGHSLPLFEDVRSKYGVTVGGPAIAVFGEDEIYNEGVSLAVIYTDLPVGWTFEGGFDVTDKHSGIVTKVQGQTIVEIDNKPALDVYDEWLGGEIERLHKQVGKPDVIKDLLTLHPVYRKYTSSSGQDYFLFSHPWPKDDEMKSRSVLTSTKIRAGERIYLSHGTWETLINRIGNLPRNAKLQGDIRVNSRPILAIGFICGGVMGVIPEAEREKLPFLINYANDNGRFIATFTWGEQGYLPGVGCKHGNLLTSFLVIGPEGEKG